MIHGNAHADWQGMSASQTSKASLGSIRAIFSRAKLHWGFIIRVPEASAAQLALPMPPPTAVVGALSSPLFRVLGLCDTTRYIRREKPRKKSSRKAPNAEEPERERWTTFSKHFDCALEATLAAAAGLTPSEEYAGVCVHQELSRLSAAPYKTNGSWEEALKSPFGSYKFYSKFLTEALPVQAVGAAYGPGVLLDLAWVFDVERLVECLNNHARLSLNVNAVDNVGVVAAYGVSRLGSKEGVQSVEMAVYAGGDSIRISSEEVVMTHLYAPVDCVEPVDIASRVLMWDLAYRPREYYLPAPSSNSLAVSVPPDRVPAYRIVPGCSAYSIRISEGGEVSVVGRRVYERLD